MNAMQWWLLWALWVCAWAGVEARPCPCADVALCVRITSPPRREVFAFRVSEEPTFLKYNWDVVTSIVVFSSGSTDDLMCLAHSHGVRVLSPGFFSAASLANATARSAWVNDLVQRNQRDFLDGVNVDFEDPVAANSSAVGELTELMKELKSAFDAALPQSQITFDVAWSPDCIDGRCYDYAALAQLTDFLFVMDYDMQSQIFPPRACEAYANSPLPWNGAALKRFFDLGIAPDRLVLGVPWYGYRYPCVNATNKVVCPITAVPFRGANCSDAAGSQFDFSTIMQWLATNASTPRMWDAAASAPFFDIGSGPSMYQVRYDDVESLSLKYALARSNGLRGVGMWHVDALDYSGEQPGWAMTQAMWAAMK